MLAGVHLPNNGAMTGELYQLIEPLSLVKALVRLDNMGQWGEVAWGDLAGHLRPDCLIILRLFFPGRLEPAEFVGRSARRLHEILPLLGGRRVKLEIHNEPNHAAGIEGWGKGIEQARDFSRWYHATRQGLRGAGFVGILGFPGLAVGQGNHNERTWAIVNRYNALTSGWVGCHCYWQRSEELDDPRLGGNWRWYRRRWPGKALFVTEAGNSSCDSPSLPQLTPDEQRAQYLRWCRLAAAGGVAGVAFYLLGGSDQWAGFRLYPGTVRALAGFEHNMD